MTAGMSSRPIAGPQVSLTRGALASLLGITLMAGGVVGATVAAELGSVAVNRSVAEVSAPDASAVSKALIQVRADERASEVRTGSGLTVNRIAPSEHDSLRLEHVPARIAPAIGAQLNEKRR